MRLHSINWSKIIKIIAVSLFYNIAFADSMDTIIKGVNYDPIHSLEFAQGMGLDNYEKMKTAIFADLDRLALLRRTNPDFKNINQIKTFDSIYFSTHINPSRPQVKLNIADVVAEWNAKKENTDYQVALALGVREFESPYNGCGENCQSLTQMEVKAAIDAVTKHKDLIDRIIVGNEDIKNSEVFGRLINDIKTIKNELTQSGQMVPVGTAQEYNDVTQMLDSGNKSYQELTNTVDFIGANIYPFWGGVPYQNATTTFENMWTTLARAADSQAAYTQKKQALPLMVTEEGWPSGGILPSGSASSTPVTLLPLSHDAREYFYYWSARINIAPLSYFFELFDRLPGQNVENHWGIFAADRTFSLLDGDYNKPLDKSKGHITVNFNNKIISDSTFHAASLYACIEDWNSQIKWQEVCYPLYGIAGLKPYLSNDGADMAANSTKNILIDNSGVTYKSLLVLYYNEENKNQLVPMCHISLNTLKKLNDQATVTLQDRGFDGSCLI